MVGGVALPGVIRAREEGADRGTPAITTARGVDTETGEPLMHLHTLLRGTDRLMVQALKTDRDLPVTAGRRRVPSRYVAISIMECG